MNERIFVISPDEHLPSGGVKQLYRHVDVLCKHGVEARILHHKKGYRCKWFENTTPTISWSEISWKDDDVIVIPEIYGPHMTQKLVVRKPRKIYSMNRYWTQELPNVRKVIFNQNAYNTFTAHSFAPDDLQTPYLNPAVMGTIVVSDDSRDYIRSVFPDHAIYRIHNAINSKLFTFEESKKKQICFMPRKHLNEVEQIINILKFRNTLHGYAIQPIDKISESEAARIMKESLIFLSFGYPEGLPLPPMEAMVSGCIVIGYHGGGAREYFTPSHGFPIEAADIWTFVRTIEQVLTEYETNPKPFGEMRLAASRYISENYSIAREENDICSAWEKILGKKMLK